MTEKEQAAGTESSQMLTTDDPPQTIYRIARKPDLPVLINVPLRFAQSK